MLIVVFGKRKWYCDWRTSPRGSYGTARSPRVDRDRQERERRAVEARLALGARRPAQRSVEVVRPGVVGALQRLAAAGALHHGVTPVAAHVHERAQLAV